MSDVTMGNFRSTGGIPMFDLTNGLDEGISFAISGGNSVPTGWSPSQFTIDGATHQLGASVGVASNSTVTVMMNNIGPDSRIQVDGIWTTGSKSISGNGTV